MNGNTAVLPRVLILQNRSKKTSWCSSARQSGAPSEPPEGDVGASISTPSLKPKCSQAPAAILFQGSRTQLK